MLFQALDLSRIQAAHQCTNNAAWKVLGSHWKGALLSENLGSCPVVEKHDIGIPKGAGRYVDETE
jgi:hypothetical protein